MKNTNRGVKEEKKQIGLDEIQNIPRQKNIRNNAGGVFWIRGNVSTNQGNT